MTTVSPGSGRGHNGMEDMNEGIRLPWWVITERQMDHYIARRSWHQRRPWGSCNGVTRGFCVRCAWRTLTGQHRRARAAHIARLKEHAFDAPTSYWERPVTKPPGDGA